MPGQKITHAGGAVIRRNPSGDHEILLIKRGPEQRKYFLPNGHIESGETEIACARREVTEETDVKDLVLIADLGVVRRRGVNDQGRRYMKTIRYFLFLSSDERETEWKSLGEEDKSFICIWSSLRKFPGQIQFAEEAELTPIIKTFLKDELTTNSGTPQATVG